MAREIEITDEVLKNLGLDPAKDFQIQPYTMRDLVAVKVNTALQSKYNLFNSSNARKEMYCTDILPNNNTFILQGVSMKYQALFTALGSADVDQTLDYYREYSSVKIFQDSTELMQLNFAEYCDVLTHVDMATLVLEGKEDLYVPLPYPMLIGKQEGLRLEFWPAPGLTTQNNSVAVPYIREYFSDDTSVGYKLLDLRLRGVKLLPR